MKRNIKTESRKFKKVIRKSIIRNYSNFRKIILVIAFLSFSFGTGIGIGIILNLSKDLPSIKPLEKYKGDKWVLPTKIYSVNNEIIVEFFEERREIVSLSSLPYHLINAVIATEDTGFYKHKGVNLKGTIRAFYKNLKAGHIKEGGSSITQQLAKVLFLTSERTYSRKIQEVLLAIQIERRYTKDEILERYFNKIYFGHGAYGVEAAALWYFGKHSKDLNLAESAMLAGLPKAPNSYSPISNPMAGKNRQVFVLNRMLNLNFITAYEAKEAIKILDKELQERENKKDIIRDKAIINKAPYFAEYIRQELEKKYGGDILYKGGLKVYATLDLNMQKAAQKALSSQLEWINKLPRIKLKSTREIDKKAGVEITTEISDEEWEAQVEGQKIEGCIIVLNPKNGYIMAMAGGSEFNKDNQFNRTVQAKRQPGSAFKPFVFTVAIDTGFKASDTIYDAPTIYQGKDKEWIPKNYKEKFYGYVTLRTSLVHSINVATVKLLEMVTPLTVATYARKMGIKSFLMPTLSLALGTSEVYPIEIATAYGVLANQGVKVDPLAIRYIEDQENNLIKENISPQTKILSEETAYIITNLLKGVVTSGTAAYGVGSKVNRPIAGKTGTTNDYADAWFIGFTPDLVAAIWVGYDKGKLSMGDNRCGGSIAGPIFASFINEALKDVPSNEFPVPKNICFATIDAKTGLLATESCPHKIREAFVLGTAPTKYCGRNHVEGEKLLQETIINDSKDLREANRLPKEIDNND
ncbi:MAG: PBP1A family penicillin-binding protein [bacterium]|nr:PBP1A family penicillin-binding protein [bacterium]